MSGTACYSLVQNTSSYRLLSKTVKIAIYITIILPTVLYGCETWSLTLRKERKLRVFENSLLRKIFWRGGGEGVENYEMRNLMICTPH
jgi:hypothetical protein